MNTRISETADRVRSAIGDIKKDKTEKKLKADLKSMAETMLSMSAAMGMDKPPSKDQMNQLRMLHGKLGAMIQRYPSPKRKTKAVEMGPAAFQAYAASELQAAISKGDAERVERLEANVDAARTAFEGGQDVVMIEVFEEQDQVSQDIDQLTKAVGNLSDQLNEVIGQMTGQDDPNDDDDTGDDDAGDDSGDDVGKDNSGDDDGDADTDNSGGDADDGDDEGEAGTAKADDGWPRDLNLGREQTPLEKYGTRKSLSDEERSFGPDPD